MPRFNRYDRLVREAEGGGGTMPAPQAPAAREESAIARIFGQANDSLTARLAESERLRTEAVAGQAAAMTDAAAARSEGAAAVQAERLSGLLKEHAIKGGIVDLDGLRLADLGSITLDDKGVLQGADSMLAALKERKPYLFGPKPGATGVESGTSSTGTGTPNPKPATTAHVREMSREQHVAARALLVPGYRP